MTADVPPAAAPSGLPAAGLPTTDLAETPPPGAVAGTGAEEAGAGAGAAGVAVQRRPLGNFAGITARLGLGCGAHGEGTGYMCGQPQMLDSSWLDDMIGYTTVMLADAEWAESPESLGNVHVARRCCQIGIPIVTTRAASNIAAILDAIGDGVKVALVRPDRYVLATTAAAVRDAMLECPAPLVLPAMEWAA